MNAAWKLNPAVFDIWAAALRAAPAAVLWQNTAGGDGAAWENLRAEARRRGVEGQLLFAPILEDQAAHLARLGQADLAFDAAPYGGHATTVDLLWAGVPVLTVAGESFCARVAASILHRAGLGELIAESLDDYRRKALELVGDPVRLRRLKRRLQVSRHRMPLFDTAGYTRALETALLGTLPPRDALD
jgi:predicted O-linked N-acetylglucosamine transferase (SPINDLY family)